MSFFPFISDPFEARLASRPRRCFVYENIGPGFHLLLVDDDGGLILVEVVLDFEVAVWISTIVNRELDRLQSGKP
jgi:hypothetical protein